MHPPVLLRDWVALAVIAVGGPTLWPLDCRAELPAKVQTVVLRDLPQLDPLTQLPRHARAIQGLPSQRHLPLPPPRGPRTEPPSPPSPAPLGSFVALTTNHGIPPDTQGAVGLKHIMVVTNGFVRVLNRSGDPLFSVDLDDFLQLPPSSTGFESTAHYDLLADRWVMTAGVRIGHQRGLTLAVASSITGDPTADWRIRSWKVATPDLWLDQPRAALTHDALVICADLISDYYDTATAGRIFVLNTAQLYQSAPATLFEASTKPWQAPATVPANEPNRIEIVGCYPYNANLELVQREVTLGPANGLTLASTHAMSAVDLIGPHTGRNRQRGTDQRLAVWGGYHPQRGMVRGDLSWWTVQ